MAVVVVSLVANHGIGYLFPTVVLCGLIQIAVGLLRLGKLIRIVPHPVMLGFVNGLAVVILLSQPSSFKALSESGTLEFLTGSRLYIMGGLVALTMAIIVLLPKLTRAIPSSLVAIVSVSLIAISINSGLFTSSNPESDTTPQAASTTTSQPNTILTVRDISRQHHCRRRRRAQQAKDKQLLDALAQTLPAGVALTIKGKALLAAHARRNCRGHRIRRHERRQHRRRPTKARMVGLHTPPSAPHTLDHPPFSSSSPASASSNLS